MEPLRYHQVLKPRWISPEMRFTVSLSLTLNLTLNVNYRSVSVFFFLPIYLYISISCLKRSWGELRWPSSRIMQRMSAGWHHVARVCRNRTEPVFALVLFNAEDKRRKSNHFNPCIPLQGTLGAMETVNGGLWRSSNPPSMDFDVQKWAVHWNVLRKWVCVPFLIHSE